MPGIGCWDAEGDKYCSRQICSGYFNIQHVQGKRNAKFPIVPTRQPSLKLRIRNVCSNQFESAITLGAHIQLAAWLFYYSKSRELLKFRPADKWINLQSLGGKAGKKAVTSGHQFPPAHMLGSVCVLAIKTRTWEIPLYIHNSLCYSLFSLSLSLSLCVPPPPAPPPPLHMTWLSV